MEYNIQKFINLSKYFVLIFFIIQLIFYHTIIEEILDSGSLYEFVPICFNYIGKSIFISSLAMILFNKYAWKWKFIRLLHDMPVLKKTYSGTFVSTYDNDTRCGNLFVQQTFLNVTIQLKTSESQSRSILAFLEKYQGIYYLIYVYQNEPRAEIQDKSPIHNGTAILNVSDPTILVGNYFTSRKTTGSMHFCASDD